MEDKYLHAAEKFAQRFKKDPNVVAIFVAGSVVHSKPDKNSDVDIHVILSESSWRERRNTWVNGIEIECFINPIKQIEEYLETEENKHTAHMWVNSVLLYKKGSAFDKLLKKAKAALKKKRPAMNKIKRNLSRYSLDDKRKDLEDIYLRNDQFAFTLAASSTLNECLSTYCAVKRIREEKIKRLQPYLQKQDPKFAKLFIAAVKETDTRKKFNAINKVISYVEKMITPRPKEWRLRGPLTVKA